MNVQYEIHLIVNLIKFGNIETFFVEINRIKCIPPELDGISILFILHSQSNTYQGSSQ